MVIPEGKPLPLPDAPTHCFAILEQGGEGQLLPMPAVWDWVGKEEEEEGADRVERRKRQSRRAHKCTLDTGEIM